MATETTAKNPLEATGTKRAKQSSRSLKRQFEQNPDMAEEPFRPREKIIQKQKYFQRVNKPTYLKGPYDKITSVAIPSVLAATAMFMTARGIYNMTHGIGKKE